MPFEGSAVSGFRVNTQAPCTHALLSINKGVDVKVLPHLSLFRIYSLKGDMLHVTEDSKILINLAVAFSVPKGVEVCVIDCIQCINQ